MSNYLPTTVTVTLNSEQEFERFERFVKDDDYTKIIEKSNTISIRLLSIAGLDIVDPEKFTDEKSQYFLNLFRTLSTDFHELYELLNELK